MDEKLSIILEKYPRRNQLDVNFTFVSCTGKSKANLKSNQDSFFNRNMWDFVGLCGGFSIGFFRLDVVCIFIYLFSHTF